MICKTPMFPGWNALAGRAAKSRLTRMEEERRAVCARGLPGMRALLASRVDPQLFAAAAAGPGSRRRVFDTATTFHAFLWQMLDGQASCREAVQQVQLSRATVKGAARPGSSTSAYCQARNRLDIGAGAEAAAAIALHMVRHVTAEDRPLGREVKLLDATGVRMDDCADAREVFGTPTGQKPGCGFPVMKLCALFSLTTGAREQARTRGQTT